MLNSGNFDAKRLLDQFLAPQQEAPGQPPATQDDPLGSLLGGLSGAISGSAGAEPSGSGDMMARARDYLAGNGGALAGGAAAGALMSLVLGSKTGRRLGSSAVKLGGLALVGTLAYKAYQTYQQDQAPQQAAEPLPPAGAALPPPESPFHPAQADATDLPLVLLRTMIAASLADGHIDDVERAAISAKLGERGSTLDEAERFLTAELASPASVEAIAGAVSKPEEAAEVYICALLAIDADTSAERAFLARLAMALRLDPQLTPHLEAAARAAKHGG
ncbi:tellurite resistance TerB family protein [Ancylobacter pratisalsi]|uniref:Tellurite resistance TerB family protein n=1 Tax=Ancylobacter pratisalsi TaxID=1745854 RepID=A0A6P1YJQ0_9HYPH|nr:tellurite resistance TerB family protein [Ancylobacter pratisalsi]QIB33345.1 tellurite resistance TerB family protein [Ancylobacter pratisalsi]